MGLDDIKEFTRVATAAQKYRGAWISFKIAVRPGLPGFAKFLCQGNPYWLKDKH